MVNNLKDIKKIDGHLPLLSLLNGRKVLQKRKLDDNTNLNQVLLL